MNPKILSLTPHVLIFAPGIDFCQTELLCLVYHYNLFTLQGRLPFGSASNWVPRTLSGSKFDLREALVIFPVYFQPSHLSTYLTSNQAIMLQLVPRVFHFNVYQLLHCRELLGMLRVCFRVGCKQSDQSRSGPTLLLLSQDTPTYIACLDRVRALRVLVWSMVFRNWFSPDYKGYSAD